MNKIMIKEYFLNPEEYSDKLTLDYVVDIIKDLRILVKDQYDIGIIAPYKNKLKLPDVKNPHRMILFVVLDEFQQVYKNYEKFSGFKLVVTTLGFTRFKNILPIPLGYCHRTREEFNPDKEPKFYFRGWSNNREEFLNSMKSAPEQFVIEELDHWAGHDRTHEAYYSAMNHYKWALSPLGACTPCYRFCEALMLGCIPVSPVNNLPWIQNTPFVKVNNWDWRTVIKAVETCNVTPYYIRDFYNEYIHPRAVASNIYLTLNK